MMSSTFKHGVAAAFGGVLFFVLSAFSTPTAPARHPNINVANSQVGLCSTVSTDADGIQISCSTNSLPSSDIDNGVAPSGTGITVNNNGYLRPFVNKITVTNAALTAAATTDITLWTTSGVVHITRMLSVVGTTVSGGGLTDVDVTCGTTAGGNQYLLTHDVDTATGTFGDAAAEVGAGLLSATYADFPATGTSIQCRFTCVGANCNAATQGSIAFFIEGTSYP